MKFVASIPEKNERSPYKYNEKLADTVALGNGKWAIVKDGLSGVNARATATYLRTKKTDVFPPGLFEVAARQGLEGDWAVYIRYAGARRTPARPSASVTNKK